jgi:hypothetical protein
MVSNKSLDEVELIAALLHDVQNAHGLVFNTRSCRLTCQKIKQRVRSEGLGFLTKTLPRLGKAFDKVLTGNKRLNAAELGFDSSPGSELPRFLGEFFTRVLQPNGAVLQNPCVQSIKVIRDIMFVFYKYELPYTDDQEQQVIQKFKETENDLEQFSTILQNLEVDVEVSYGSRRTPYKSNTTVTVAREAKILLSNLFCFFDPLDIHPKHGPGSVATKQRNHEKYIWTNVSSRITDMYPLDAYYYASFGHVCDCLDTLTSIKTEDLPARVILVPKDSRGPRLISCEPVDFQWIQQGLGKAIVQLVERHELTKFNVFFTDQTPNRIAALYGSENGRYSTLDLNEASDRVSADLVRLLFPSHLYKYLDACRSSSTELPDGQVIKLKKFAPMGSCLCFPILALTTWAILTAGAPDAETRESLHVYGDDVIVPTAYAANAIELLESFGLKVNRDKSCTSGFFRESCGMDAFRGTCVTPVRIRTLWSSTPRPESYASWIAYANQLFDRKYFLAYDYVVGRLLAVYGPIPDASMSLTCPCLREVPDSAKPKRRRYNSALQKVEYRVTELQSPIVNRTMSGWSMLLRYFAEASDQTPLELNKELDDECYTARPVIGIHYTGQEPLEVPVPFSVSSYTNRRASMLVRRWR